MTENIYNNINPEDYEKRRNKNQIEEYQYQHWYPLISEAIQKYSKDAVVLDLGCGPGEYTSKMAKYAKKVFGVDSAERMIEYAKKNYPEINFIKSNAESTPIEDKSVDVVFSFGLFEYVESKEKLMKEISRVLKPGGIAVVLAPNKYSFPRFLFFILYKIIGKKRVCHEPSFGQMKKIFFNNGFEILNYNMDDGLFFMPYGKNRFFFGKKSWLFVEKLFKKFKRNPFSMNMFFIIKKI